MKWYKKLQSYAIAAVIMVTAGIWGDAEAATYYVRRDGNNNCTGSADAGGSSGSCAKLSVQAAYNLANAGDTVIVHAGTYAENAASVRSGLSGSPITLRAASGETVTINRVSVSHNYNVIS
jgi:hypothetical protein